MTRITGRLPEEAADRRLEEIVPLRNADDTVALLSSSPPAATNEGRLVRLDAACGEARWLTIGRAGLAEGGFAFVAQDVTEQRRAEQAVRTSEERLRLALDAGSMGWWEWDMASGDVRWSENLERIYALAPGGFSGIYEEFISRVHPDDREFVQQTIERGLAEGRHDFVHRIVRKDGSVRWLEGKGRVVLDAEGRPRGMTGVAFDVSERERAKGLAAPQARALEQIAAGAPLPEVLDLLVRLVEEHAGDVLASVLLLDEDGLHLRHGAAWSLPAAYREGIDGIAIGPNAGSCGTAAYRRERVVVSDIAADPLWDGARELALSHGLRACWSEPILSTSGGVLGTLALYHREPRAPAPEDLELAASVAHVAGIAIGRAQQEERLSRTEAEHRRLVEHLPLAVYRFVPRDDDSPAGALRYVSPQIEHMLGYELAQWRANPGLFAEIVHPDDRERVLAEIREARASGNRYSGEYRLVAKDGRTVWVQDESVYVRDDEGSLTAVEGYFIDVTGRKTLESDLLHAQKMEAIGRLAGGVAHDFNNMMSAVVGFSKLVLARLEEAHPVRRQVEQIQRAGERASQMTHQLLAFSRKQVLQPRVLVLNTVVAGTATLLERLIGEDVELACVLDPHLDAVEADPVQLEQVLLNLAVNARDAMPTGGKLTIETANVAIDQEYAARHLDIEPGRYVLLAVTDTGTGMDAETQARIFEPFFTTKEQGDGTGLGLATVFGIIKQSGGEISVYSEAGRGTSFKVYLPRAETAAPSSEITGSRLALPRGSETVLLVEDEDVVRSLEREVLEELGYRVLEARGAPHALELAQRHRGAIDLLLTDVVMPGLSGPELAERLAGHNPDTRVLYASGYADEAIVRHGLVEPGLAFLPKPLTPHSLAHKVREVLDTPQGEHPVAPRHTTRNAGATHGALHDTPSSSQEDPAA